ncbi:MAG: ABC transporter ATP-binding protein [Planctomycetota bacterium]|jgi:predicted ABC-type transport system involved in lysophospholipase L1 biosynthesis ATPase subunit
MSAAHRLEAVDVVKAYAAVGGADAVDGAGAPPVLQGVSLTLDAGESVAIVGPSGCGKSTLLNVLGALVRPTSGTVRFEGEDLYARDETALAAFRNRCLGFVFQAHHLLPQCSALENVLVPTVVHPDADLRRGAVERARSLLDRVGLADRMAHRPGQLSGGECQRVAVARALVNRPRLVLADEPTGSLDEAASDRLIDLLTDLHRADGVTLGTVTHASRLAARMERGLALRHGRLEPWTP